MKIYVNGDSHAAAAEAVNAHAFAEDDGNYVHLGRRPHPDNVQASWAQKLSGIYKATLHLEAESASSNDRILRTARHWLAGNSAWNSEVLVIIQWSTWEREEWQHTDGTYYQVNASGIDHVPESMQQRYKQFVADVDWNECTKKWHDKIWGFHNELDQQNIKHVFFNGNNYFGKIPKDQRHDWGTGYIGPYKESMTYHSWLVNNGFETVSPDSWHFGPKAHAAWARFMLQYIVDNKLLG
jgi:hypothetical protein